MRQRDPQPVDSFHHVVARGGRGMRIVNDDNDRWNFLRLLFYVNDANHIRNWERDLSVHGTALFDWPMHWPVRDPLVYILAFCLHDNHFHLLLKQIKEDGISQFMHRLPTAMARRYNDKYGNKGGLFQGKYRSRVIQTDADLCNVALYIMVKNVFERFPGGVKGANAHFTHALKWALSDPFSSFADYAAKRNSPILEKDLLVEVFNTPNEFKNEVRGYLRRRLEKEESIKELLLE